MIVTQTKRLLLVVAALVAFFLLLRVNSSLTAYQAVAIWLEGIALVLIFVWDRIDARQQHKETLAQLSVSQAQADALINSERPWLLIPIENKIYDIQPPVIIERLAGTISVLSSNCMFGVKNYGRSPARVIEHKFWMIRIGEPSFPSLSAYYGREGSVKMDYIVAPGTTIPVSVLLEGGDGKLTPQEKEAIDTGRNFLWLAGYVLYSDTFERRDAPIYETRFCYRWVPRSYLVPEPLWMREGPPEYNRTT